MAGSGTTDRFPGCGSYLHPPRTLGQVLAPADEFPSRWVICTLLGQWTNSWHPLADFLVGRAICVLPGQQGGVWHSLMDFLVTEAICTLLGQHGQALGTVGGISSGWICPHPSGSVGAGLGICLWIWKRQPVPTSGAQDGDADSCPLPQTSCWEHSQG